MSSSSVYENPNTWRLRTPLGIPFRIVENSGSFKAESASATGKYLIRATDLAAFVVEAFPSPIQFGNNVYYPASPTFAGTVLFVKEVSWQSHMPGLPCDPFNADSSAPAGTYHPILEVDVEYGAQKDQNNQTNPNDPKSFLRITGRAAGEYIHTDAPEAKWTTATATGGGGNAEPVKTPDVPSTVIVPEMEWTVTWERIPRNTWDTKIVDKLRDKLGLLNDSSVALLHGAPKETIMFVGFDFEEQYTWRTLNQPPVKLDLKFLEKRVTDADGKTRGHNAFWRPGKGWQRLLIDGTNPSFKTTDIDEIWKP